MPDEKEKHAYDDIIDKAYPFQLRHPRMPQNNRAAQFSSFQALSGFNSVISEATRTTEKRIDLGEETKQILNTKLQIISDYIMEQPLITMTYFLLDDKKDGGTYCTVSEGVKKIDEYEKTIMTTSGCVISFDDIYGLQGELFSNFENIGE